MIATWKDLACALAYVETNGDVVPSLREGTVMNVEIDPAFLSEVQAQGLRCVLVITGRGTTKAAGGVLRAQVPRWLNEPGNRARILAFDYAQPKDGGLGALYVMIRRKRAG